MSLVLFNIDRKGCRILTDTASFTFEGKRVEPSGFSSKLLPLAHLNAAVACIGSVDFGQAVFDTIQRSPALDFDDLSEMMQGLIAMAFGTARSRSGDGRGPSIQYHQALFLFGFSPKHDRPRAFVYIFENDFRPIAVEQGTGVCPLHTLDPLPQRFDNPQAGLVKLALEQYGTYAERHRGLGLPLMSGGRMLFTTIDRQGTSTRLLSTSFPNAAELTEAVEGSAARRTFRTTLQATAGRQLEQVKAAKVPSTFDLTTAAAAAAA